MPALAAEPAGFSLHSDAAQVTDQEFCMPYSSIPITFTRSGTLWSEYRDPSLSWLALGVLLAAWNGCDDDPRPPVTPRPDILREYPVVSRRALQATQVLPVTETCKMPPE